MSIDLVKRLGGPALVSRTVGVAPPTVATWRSIPIWACPIIEARLGLPCEAARPDADWARIPDSGWPHHPEGRPVHDVAATAMARGAV